ncbi:MAG: ABC transporter ATP-binding protein [Elusimicrobia bacterium]|nr:ABC transporter ATP-binding protein [Elusimicrobiota bacterium]
MSVIVRFENLTKVYRLPGFLKSREVVGIHDLNLEIEEGEVFGLLGLNGSGKTTTIRLMLGLIAASAGRALVLGREAAKDSGVRSHLGYLPENATLPPALTPVEFLRFLGRIDRNKFPDRAKLQRRIHHVLKIVGLEQAADRKISSFSKGMTQRLGIAQAILHEPKLLVLDEPASGLDPLGIVEMRELFLKLNKELGMTVVFSSHSIGEVEKVSHRAAIVTGNCLQRLLMRKDWDGSGKTSLEKHFLECAQTLYSQQLGREVKLDD